MKATRTTRTSAPAIMHMVHGPSGSTRATTLCGQRIIIDAQGTARHESAGDYVVCALCEAAWTLADERMPDMSQGTLW